MVRLHLVVEGQTEESFVRSILAVHLGHFDISTDARCVTTSRQAGRPRRGGLSRYGQLRLDLELWIKQDGKADSFFSTMVDLYRLPEDFPGFDVARREKDPRKRVEMLEEAFRADVNHVRFVPYIQLHEFEALLFSDLAKLRLAFPDHEPALARLAEVVTQFASPEHIDDGATTSPSKRIIKEIPGYIGRKTSAAVPVLQEIGLKRVRERCGHFDGWITNLESLGASPDDSEEKRHGY